MTDRESHDKALPKIDYDARAMQKGIDEDFFVRQMLPLVASTVGAEKFIIKTCSQAKADIDDAELRREIVRLNREESRHIRAHNQLLKFVADHLEADSRPLNWARDAFLRRFANAPKRLRISIAAAYEYAADAYLGAFVDHYNDLEKTAPQTKAHLDASGISALMLWHAKEEYGHRDVAHEVAERLEIGYALRILGFLCVAFDLSEIAARALFAFSPWKTCWKTAFTMVPGNYGHRVLKYMLQYFKPGFHPSHAGSEASAGLV